MAHFLSLTFRATAVGVLVAVAAIASRQIYLTMEEEEIAPSSADENAPATMMTHCASAQSKLQGRRDLEDPIRAKAMVRPTRCIAS